MAAKKITLKCGVEMDNWRYDEWEYLKVSIVDLYAGYGTLNSLKLLSDILLELSDLGYEGNGMDRIEGWYGATDDLILTVKRKILI
jgi:hypothetical protein